MRPVATLLAYSIRRARGLLAGLAAVLLFFQVMAAQMASTFQESSAFSRMADLVPDYMRQMLGPSMVSMLSFTGIALLGYFHVAIVTALVAGAIAVGTEPAGEVERGFADLMLSRPISRGTAVTRSFVLLASVATSLTLVMLVGTWLGLALFGGQNAWPGARLLLGLSANLWALMFCWGGVALAVGAGARRRGTAGVMTGLVAFGLFLVDVVGRIWQPARAFRVVSPFRYFNPIELISGRSLAWSHLAVLCGIGLAGVAAAYVIFSRRDL